MPAERRSTRSASPRWCSRSTATRSRRSPAPPSRASSRSPREPLSAQVGIKQPEAHLRREGEPMKRRLFVGLALLVLALTLPLVAFGDVTVGSGGGTPGTSLNFQLVGSNPLFARGMNAALTIYDHYAYIGNRTDGSDTCGIGDPRRGVTPCPPPHPGILIADAASRLGAGRRSRRCPSRAEA